MKKKMQMITMLSMSFIFGLMSVVDIKTVHAFLLPDISTDTNTTIITPGINWDELYFDEYPLQVYEYLNLQNTKDITDYNNWTYLDFLSMKLYRSDNRVSYDNDGYLTFSDIVNYESYIEISTKLMQHKNTGFMGTTLNAKLKSTSLSAPFLELKYIDNDTRETMFSYLDTSAIRDKNQNVGNGNYANSGINPGIETYKFTDINIENIAEPFMLAQMYFQGRVYWENAWWGGTGNEIDLYDSISTLFKVAKRDWNNELLTPDDVIEDEYLSSSIIYYHKPLVVTASNLNNYIKIDDELVIPIENEKIMPYKNGHRMIIDQNGLTKIELETDSENYFQTYYILMDDSVPQVTIETTNENALKQYQEQNETINQTGHKTKNIYATYRQPVQINFQTNENESLETASYTFNNQTQNLSSSEWLNEDGEYVITVTDLVGHKTVIYLTINTTLDFSLMVNDEEINLKQAEFIHKDISIITTENLNIEVLQNGLSYEYAFGEILTEEARYEIVIFDDSGNVKNFNITIDKTPPKVSLINVKNNGVTNKTVRLEFLENDIYANYHFNETLMGEYISDFELIVDGKYSITVFDLAGNEKILHFEIDTIPPTLELVGVTNGGQTQYEVSTKNLSEPAQIFLTKDTLVIEYEIGKILQAVGSYEMIVVDLAGNKTIYAFEIVFVLNAAAIALFAGLIALAVAGTIFLIKTREIYYVDF